MELNKMELYYDIITEFYINAIDIDCDYYTEGLNVLAPIDRILSVFVTYKNQIKKIQSETKELKSINKSILLCERIEKKTPELRNKKFIFIHRPITLKPNEKELAKYYGANIATAIIHNDNQDVLELAEEYFKNFYNAEKYSRKITLKEAGKMLNEAKELYENDIDNEYALLKNVRDMLALSKDQAHSVTVVDSFKELTKSIIQKMTDRRDIIRSNINDFVFDMGDALDNLLNRYSENDIQKIDVSKIDSDNIIKHSKLIETIDFGGDVLKVYQTEYDNVSAFNMGGLDIYVSNDYFKRSPAMQQAILLHEIGHYLDGHFHEPHVEYKDEELYRILKGIKRKYKHFCSREGIAFKNPNVMLSALLIEIEADRYAANMVGKRLMKKSNKQTMWGIINNSPSLYGDNHMGFYMQTKLRNKLM